MSPGVRAMALALSRSGCARLAFSMGSTLFLVTASVLSAPSPAPRGITYRHNIVPQHPWSIHVAMVDRRQGNLVMRTTLGGGEAIGLRPLSDQVKALPAEAGTPLVALNGDFYTTDYHYHHRHSHPPPSYAGDPRGLHIMEGELVSAATDQASFWITADGIPHATNVTSRLAVTWPDGTVTPLGLNEQRQGHEAVLYTRRLGTSTRTPDGVELILESSGSGPWLPLRPQQEYTARLREIRRTGNSPIAPDSLVLSLPADGRAGTAATRIVPGQALRISTASLPDLRGVPLAISGGEVLVRDGRKVPLKPLASLAYKYRSALERHPRSAIGASRDAWVLVQVDGRQPLLSKGMTLDELADYLLGLGCELAMSLDGGPSSTFWMEGEVRNSPCNRHERPVANGIVILQQATAPAAPARDPRSRDVAQDDPK